ncbi:MAG TPA: hypothetical protein VK550_07335 [Polyangiaceae bacterium]|jgi:hypothetical protein|nr:hypothetical protein [Polyangiaceae bacterium]
MIGARAPLAALGGTAVVLVGLAWHAHLRAVERRREQPAIDAMTRLLPAPDLSFAGSARHLRFPSLEEPGAAFADAPGMPDLDPAGAAVAPPTEVYAHVDRGAARTAAPHVPWRPFDPR